MALDSVTVERLKSMRAMHLAERLAVGVRLGPEDVLAANEDGTPLRPETLAVEAAEQAAAAEVMARLLG